MNKLRLGIINYQAGNLGSVQNAFMYLQNQHKTFANINLDISLESRPEKLMMYDKLLLPGVGAFGKAMECLKATYLDEAIKDFVRSGKHLLGICLGMQLLFDKSEEFGVYEGLGLINGEVVCFTSKDIKIPHIGWNSCSLTEIGSKNALLKGIKNHSFFYFVHSFFVKTKARYILAHTHYGHNFASIIAHDNIYGIQAHPEKSHNIGLELLANFVSIK